MTASERCQLVIDILEATHDGKDLYQTPEEIERHGPNGDGEWLYMLQCAANAADGRDYPTADRVLVALGRQVQAGDYHYEINDFVAHFVPEVVR
jgi:hypothetical protein